MNGRRFAELAMGHSINKALDYMFDYVLYPAAIWNLGAFLGGGVMAVASLAICLCCLRLYDWSKRDWLGIEAIKSLRTDPSRAGTWMPLARLLRMGTIPAFLGLSIYTDPFITTAYMRSGAFNGMSKRDWSIFIGSWLIGNLEWILIVSGGIWVVREIIVSML